MDQEVKRQEGGESLATPVKGTFESHSTGERLLRGSRYFLRMRGADF